MFDDLVVRAAALARGGRRAVLGITGCPAAGKSTLAERLAAALGDACAYVPMDGFHLADASLDRLGRRERKGAIDTFDGYGYLALLRRLRTETANTVFAPGFERTLEQPIAAAIAVGPGTDLVITEGNYLLTGQEPWPRVRAELAQVWYCELDHDARYERLLERHIRFGKTEAKAREWIERVDEPNARLIERTRDRADLVVDMARDPQT